MPVRGGPGGTLFALYYPNGTRGNGLEIRDGAFVDSLALICRGHDGYNRRWTQGTAQAGGGGGGSLTLLCQCDPGHYLTGLRFGRGQPAEMPRLAEATCTPRPPCCCWRPGVGPDDQIISSYHCDNSRP